MTNHPNRSGRGRNPRPDEIKALREEVGMSIEEAARLVFSSPIRWAAWESGESRMHPAFWALFRITAYRKA